MQIGARYVQQRGEQQRCSYVDSLCINIAPSTGVTVYRRSASGKTYTCLLVYDHDHPLQHVRWCMRPYTCPPNSFKSHMASSIAHTVQHEECLWTVYTWSSVGPNLKWPRLGSGSSVVKYCFSFVCSCPSRFPTLVDQPACEHARQIPLRECALK